MDFQKEDDVWLTCCIRPTTELSAADVVTQQPCSIMIEETDMNAIFSLLNQGMAFASIRCAFPAVDGGIGRVMERAIDEGRVDVVRTLLANAQVGYGVHSADRGLSYMDMAARAKNIPILQLLFDHGARINCADPEFPTTPLLWVLYPSSRVYPKPESDRQAAAKWLIRRQGVLFQDRMLSRIVTQEDRIWLANRVRELFVEFQEAVARLERLLDIHLDIARLLAVMAGHALWTRFYHEPRLLTRLNRKRRKLN